MKNYLSAKALVQHNEVMDKRTADQVGLDCGLISRVSGGMIDVMVTRRGDCVMFRVLVTRGISGAILKHRAHSRLSHKRQQLFAVCSKVMETGYRRGQYYDRRGDFANCT